MGRSGGRRRLAARVPRRARQQGVPAGDDCGGGSSVVDRAVSDGADHGGVAYCWASPPQATHARRHRGIPDLCPDQVHHLVRQAGDLAGYALAVMAGWCIAAATGHTLKPPAGFCLTISGTYLRHSRTAPVSDLHRTTPSQAATATVTVLPGAAEPPCRILFANSWLTRRAASSPQGCPGPSTAATNARATRARPASSRPPAERPVAPRAQPGKCTLDSAAHVKAGHGPVRPVRGRPWKTSGYTDRPGGPTPVRYTSVAPATQRSTARQGDTPRDKEEQPA